MKKFLLMMTLLLMTLIPLNVNAEYVSAKSGLRIRQSGSLESEILNVLHYGDEVKVITKGKEWCYVHSDKGNGYVATEYLTDTDPLNGMEYLGNYRITAYAYTGSPCANGSFPTYGYTVACNSLPFGTEVYIEGVGFRVVEDRGPSWLGSAWMDLYLESYSACIQWGDQYRDVYLVRSANA